MSLHQYQGRGPVAWMARHGVAPNLLMAFLIVGGFLMSLTIRKEFIPAFEADMVIINVGYPGATPSEMAQGVVLPIENELGELDGLKNVNVTISQGSARLNLELENGVDRQQAYQNVLQAVNRITIFPAQMERPIISVASRSIGVMELALFGPVDRFELKRLAESVSARLLADPGITKVELSGVPDEEIHVEIPRQQLERYGLTLAQIANALGSNALEQSAGTVRASGGDILVTFDNRRYWAGEFLDLPIVADASGVKLRLGDIASVEEGFSDTNSLVTYNGQMAIRFDIYRAEQQTPLTVTRAAYAVLEEIRPTLPPGISLIVTDDDGKTYQQRVGLLLKNAVLGLILVMVLLSLFLEYRLAFWVTMGIPTSFLGALLILPAADISINMVSMFAFIVALGIVVDDAIIAGENIYEHMQQGMPFREAAVVGAHEVSGPLAFAILTNVAAFLPLLALPGVMGKLFIAIPIVVVSCFLISWIEALFILPTHLANLGEQPGNRIGRRLDAIQEAADRALGRFIRHRYQPVLERCLNNPGITLAIALSLLMLVLAWPISGRMGFSMFPRLEGEFTVATVELPSNVPFSRARDIRELVEQRLREVVAPIEAAGTPLLVSVQGKISDSTVEVEARLVDSGLRPVSAHELAQRWRTALGELPGVRSLSFDSERGGGPSGGAGLTVELSGTDTDELRLASQELERAMAELGGVKDVANSFTSGKPQWSLELTDLGRSLGLDVTEVAAQVRAAIYGARALRQQRQANEVTVLVRLPETERAYADDIRQVPIRTGSGAWVPLAQVADIVIDNAPSRLTRRNGRQILQLTADVEPRTQIPAVMTVLSDEVFEQMKARYPGISFDFRGRQADTRESMSAMQLYGFFSLLLIYVLLAIPFRSYSQPLLIMMVIPFGAAGAFIGHLLLGYSLSIMSVMGIVALAGVVVNDSLILVDYANRQRQTLGLSAYDAIRDAGVRRFRPILLTTLTTFGGLAPMVFETSRQAQFITPMAVALGFGILFTTFVCLLVLPSLYVMLDSLLQRLGGERGVTVANAG